VLCYAVLVNTVLLLLLLSLLVIAASGAASWVTALPWCCHACSMEQDQVRQQTLMGWAGAPVAHMCSVQRMCFLMLHNAVLIFCI